MAILEIGCGPNKIPNCIGLDWENYEGVDIVHDMTQIPWPISDASFDVVIAKHVLEHFDGYELIQIIEEVYRVLKDGGQFLVEVPDAKSPNRYRDPTHKTRDWSPDSFMFWEVDQYGEYIIYRGPKYNMKAKFLQFKPSQGDPQMNRKYWLRKV